MLNSLELPGTEVKACVYCGTLIPRSAVICSACKNHQDDNVRCIACGTPLPYGAKICLACKSHQSRWRNSLAYVAGVAGIITVVTSVGSAAYLNITNIIRESTWVDSVDISLMRYPGHTLFANTGEGTIYIHSVEVYWPQDKANKEIPVGLTLAKGEVKEVNFEYDADVAPTRNGGTVINRFNLLANRTGKPSQKVIDESAQLQNDKRCVLYSLYSNNDPELARISRFYDSHGGGKLQTIPVEAYINWVSIHTGAVKRDRVDDILMGFPFDADAGCDFAQWNGSQ